MKAKGKFLRQMLKHFFTSTLGNWVITSSSVIFCLLLLIVRLPGMEVLGIAPNWALIWVVTWSVKRSIAISAIAGLILGLLQDSMTAPIPTHALSLACVGMLTACLHKQRYIQEDFISIALIVFGMTLVAETIVAVQFAIPSGITGITNVVDEFGLNLAEIWTYRQQIALCEAIVSSLWGPVVYYPLNRWWQFCRDKEQGEGEKVRRKRSNSAPLPFKL